MLTYIIHAHIIAVGYYEATLRASSKERELKLQSQLDTVQYEYQQKEKQLSKLKNEILEMQKEVFDVEERHRKELQQKGKNTINFTNLVVNIRQLADEI